MAMKRDDAKTSHLALLIIHPFQEDSNLIERESRDKSTGEIDMDFVRATRRIRAEFSRSMYSIRLDPGQGIASESSFGPAPVSTEDFHSLLGIAGQDRKRQPINRESECRLHGTYRTPVKNPVVRAPVLPRRGLFRSAPQPVGIGRGPASPVDCEAESTLLSVLPVPVV